MRERVNIEEFQGPLDLLLNLITQNKIDIMDIPIAEITEQYNAIIQSWSIFDLEEASEYILMAARLMQIKAKMLLPRPKRGEEEEDPRLDLASQLAQYAVYQKIARFLEEKERYGSKSFFKDPEYLPHLCCERPADISLKELESALRRLLLAKERQSLPSETYRPDRFSVEDKKDRLTFLLKARAELPFSILIKESSCAEEAIVTFLAMLELYKTGILDFEQTGYEITITRADTSAA